MNIKESLKKYAPYNEQEASDKAVVLQLLDAHPDIFTRENKTAHFTASSWLVNKTHDKVLMIYHNIYNSWSWTGGHADGDEDLLAVAKKEAMEETGVENITAVTEDIFSIETVTVDGHEKRGAYVPSHLHLNVTYLLEADEDEVLRVKPDENSGVRWFSLDEALKASTEPWMVERIYKKLNEKLIKKSWEAKAAGMADETVAKAKVQSTDTAHTPKNVISDETIEYVGILAKLELSDEEKENAKKDMGEMLDYIDKLNELDTTGVEPMSHVFPVNNVFREDVVTNGDGSMETLANAPSKKDGGFKVPKTIG